jgi:hypothetical protein
MKEPVTDMRSCCDYLKDTEFKITAREINRLNVSSLSPAARAAVYGGLSFNRGRVGQALSFIKVGKRLALSDEERVLLLHIEGIILSMAGDGQGALERQHESLDGCRLLDDTKLTAEVLSHLSFLYQTQGEKELAKKYEKQAARLLLKNDFPRPRTMKRRAVTKKDRPFPQEE